MIIVSSIDGVLGRENLVFTVDVWRSRASVFALFNESREAFAAA